MRISDWSSDVCSSDLPSPACSCPMADQATPTHQAAAEPVAVSRRDPASATLAVGFSMIATIVGLILLAWAILFITKGRFLKPTFEKYASRSAERTDRKSVV